VRARLAVYEDNRDLITLGAYQQGRDRAIDDAVSAYPAIERFVKQSRSEVADMAKALSLLQSVAR
jgi:flagellum-specific ATP synthase